MRNFRKLHKHLNNAGGNCDVLITKYIQYDNRKKNTLCGVVYKWTYNRQIHSLK